MIFGKHLTTGALLVAFAASTLPAHAVNFPGFGKKKKDDSVTMPTGKLTPNQSALIDKAVTREKDVIKVVKERAPLVETYIQNMRPDPVLLQVPESDQHFLGRVDFGKVINDDNYVTQKQATKYSGKLGLFKRSATFLGGLGTSLHLTYNQAGFVQMVLMDSNGFDKQHYAFGFVRNDFLGSIPTAVFNVTPISGKRVTGRFFGRIWIETRSGAVVRFNGDFAGGEKEHTEYYHFDSWRTNVQENLWLPTSFYVEESDPKSTTNTLKFKAINHVWGYALKVPQRDAEATGLEVVGATDVSNDATDMSPLGAERAWVQQAEDNVIDRLFQAGLLDAPSEFDKTLEAIANNILAYNNIPLSRPIRVRTLLTEPLESIAIGNTVILSKSLIDTTGIVTTDGAQQMGNLNALLAFQVAHILLGHRLNTKYAFNDRLLFPDTSSFVRIPMHHTDADNMAAAKKAIELLSAKELTDGQQYFGLYLQELQTRVKGLKALNQPMIGDGLTKSDQDTSFWMQAMVPKGIKLNVADLKQQAAMPLSSFLRFDPWTDQVVTLHSTAEPILAPSDKMPFEAEPVFMKLAYYKAPVDPATLPPAQGAPAANGMQSNPATQPAPAPATAPQTTTPAPR